MKLVPLATKTLAAGALPNTMLIEHREDQWKVSSICNEGSGPANFTTGFDGILLEACIRGIMPTLVFQSNSTLKAFLGSTIQDLRSTQEYINIMLTVPHQQLVLTHDQVRTILLRHRFSEDSITAFLKSPGSESWMVPSTKAPTTYFRQRRLGFGADIRWDPAFFYRCAQWATEVFAITNMLDPEVFPTLNTTRFKATIWGTQMELKEHLPTEHLQDSSVLAVAQMFKPNGRPISTPKLLESVAVPRRLRTFDVRLAGSDSYDVEVEILAVSRPVLQHSSSLTPREPRFVLPGGLPMDVLTAGGCE